MLTLVSPFAPPSPPWPSARAGGALIAISDAAANQFLFGKFDTRPAAATPTERPTLLTLRKP
jgi:hypothetical protein